MTQLGGFTFEDAQAIHRQVLGKSTSQKAPTGKVTVFNRAYYARLTEDLPAATDPLTGYTQAEATVLRYLAESQDTLDMEETSEPIVVTNRSTNYSAQSGDVIQVDRLGSEWAPKHASGGANNSGDNCGCSCIEDGDLVVNDIDTTRVMCVAFNTLVFNQTNGSIKLPAGDYCLVWSSATQSWVLDVGDNLEANYLDGSDATSNTIMDGSITLTFPSSGMSTLSVCVTGTVPVKPAVVGLQTGYAYGYENGFIDGYAGNPYDDRVIFAGATGTGAGTGQYQQFGTGTYLAPGTGTYGENTGTGTGTGTFMWSDYEEQFYAGYKLGYPLGYDAGVSTANPGTGTYTGTGTSPGTGTYTPPGTSVPPEEP